MNCQISKRIQSVNKIENETTPTNTEELRIAWRYGQQQQQTSTDETIKSSKSMQANYFVMNKFLTEEEIKTASNVKSFTLSETDCSSSCDDTTMNPLYKHLATDITTHIDDLNMNINKTKKYTNILRIGYLYLF